MAAVARSGASRKPAAETLRERLAFNDPDRSTPLHDDICLWLDGKLREPLWLSSLVEGDFRLGAVGPHKSWTVDYVRKIIDKHTWPEGDPAFTEWDVPPARAKITWELAVGDSRWVSGFIDIAATVRSPHSLKAVWREGKAYLGGRADDIECSWSGESEYAFEVKSAIPSLGELIRQIRYYQSKHRATYYVVAPSDTVVINGDIVTVPGDGTIAKTLVAQGIGFVHYPSGDIRKPTR